MAAQIPPKGTPEYDLWIAALDVALGAPLRQSGNAYSATVPWQLIHELRKAFEAVGIDWRKHHKGPR